MSDQNGSTAALSKAQRKLARLETRRKLAEARIALARAERRAKAEELKTQNWWPRPQRNPGHELLREALTSKSKDAREQLMEAKRLGKDIPEGNFLWDWVSGYQDLIDRLQSPDGLLLSAISIAADRMYGGYWPFFRTWNDLALLRGASRILYQTSSLARGAVNGVASYIVGDGFKYRVAEKEGCPAGLRLACQEILDANSDLNDWPAIEYSCVIRDSRDGEWYLRDFAQDDGTTLTRVVEPEQLIQPGDSSLKEWSFGKQNPLDPYDVQQTLQYHVCYDGVNTHGAMVPADQVHEHVSNVDATVKRGIPDLAYDTYDFLKVAGRLIENMGEGSAIQAAISEIIQFDGPVTPDQADGFLANDADYQVTDPWTGTEKNVRQVRPGERLVIPKGGQFIAPPFSQGSPVFIQVEQAVLRAVAVTWNAPEWLTSGDSSNNNYASSLTAESPFVKRGSHRQNVWYKPRFTRARWSVLRNYCEAKGGIMAGGRKFSWDEVRKYIDLQCEPPSMEVRNKGEEASANSIRVQAGWKSRQTVASEEGLDWEQERRNIEEYNETMGGAGSPLQLPDDSGGLGGLGGGDNGKPPALGEQARRLLTEAVLREEGFTGVDKHGHHWVNGKQVAAHKTGSQAKKKDARAAAARADLVAKGQKQLAGDVKGMQATPAGKAELSKGQQLAAAVREKVTAGVQKAVEAIDTESGGGLSLLAGSLKSKDPTAAAAGVSRLVSTVYSCVHEEMFELMLSQQTGGPAFAAKAAAKAGAKGAALVERGLFKAAVWAMSKLRGASEGVLHEGAAELTDADKQLLAALAKVAGGALRDVLAGVGIEDAEVDESVLAERLAGMLAGAGA